MLAHTLCANRYDPTTINNQFVQMAENARYLGLYMDRKLIWRTHIQIKGETTQIKVLRNARNALRQMLYVVILRPVSPEYLARSQGPLIISQTTSCTRN